MKNGEIYVLLSWKKRKEAIMKILNIAPVTDNK